MKTPLAALLVLVPACATGTAPYVPGDDELPPDAMVTSAPDGGVDPDDPDAAPPDGAPAAATGTSLLLTEIVLAPTELEMIEIANPTAAVVTLSDYYLADVPSYFRLPGGTPTIDASDFIARFPAGATLAPGAVAVIALGTSAAFTTAAGVAPTYAISGGTMTVVASSGTPTLTNGGELIALFRWDGATDLVTDVDLVLAGAPTPANGLTMKSSVALDGPDTGAALSTYKPDAGTLPAQASAPGSGVSTKRLLPEVGHETQGGAGNGVGGDDETSEVTTVTWDATFTAPTPGTTPLAL